MPRYEVYVPTKGRALTCQTPRLLEAEGIRGTLVVEPQEATEYRDAFPGWRILRLEKSGQGIAYARTACKRESIRRGESCHWQLDDNIKAFRIRSGGKNWETGAGILMAVIEDHLDRHPIVAAGGMKHACFAFAARRVHDFNVQVYSAVLFRNEPAEIEWRGDAVEDTDYSLQLLTAGYCTVIFNRLLIDKPATASMKGGNKDEHLSDVRRQKQEGLQKYWPGAFKIYTDQKGISRVRPSRIWRTFTQRPDQLTIELPEEGE